MELKDILLHKIKEARKKLRGIRSFKIEDIFKRIGYIYPQDIKVINYPRYKPFVAFNPGALKVNDNVILFPRLIFDYYLYSSSIGLTERLNLDEILSGNIKKPIETRIILWPKFSWDLNGCEDARVHVHNDLVYVLYTAYGFYRLGPRNYTRKPLLGLAILDMNFNIRRRGVFKIVKDGKIFIPDAHKSCAIVKIENNTLVMLERPIIDGNAICWKALGSLEDLTVDLETFEPILVNEVFEEHVGWSTNVVKLSKSEYLVGWHAMVTHNLAYYNGLAIVDDEGNLLAISNYLLTPKGVIEEYGDRSQVIYGSGLVKYKEYIIWFGGVSDYCIGIFVTELDKAMEKMKWLKG